MLRPLTPFLTLLLGSCAVGDSPTCMQKAGVISAAVGATECDRDGNGCDCVESCRRQVEQDGQLAELLDAGLPLTFDDVGGKCDVFGRCACEVWTRQGCFKKDQVQNRLVRVPCPDGGTGG